MTQKSNNPSPISSTLASDDEISTTMTLLIYARVSTSVQAEEGYSLDAQVKCGVSKAESLGMSYEIFREEGASASLEEVTSRPVLTSLLDRVADGGKYAIFCTEQDRLSRNVVAMEVIKKILVDCEIPLYTLSSVIDFRDTEQEFMSDIITLLARRENTLRVMRSRRGLKEAALQGKWIGVVLPYGYRLSEEKTLEVDPTESEIIKLVFSMNRLRHGTKAIAQELNRRKVPTRCSKVLENGIHVKNKYTGNVRHVPSSEISWKAGTVYTILKNPIYCGRRRYRGEIIDAPGIITAEEWQEAQMILTSKKKHSSPNQSKHFYLLKGMLRCKRCGRNLYGRIKPDERYYMCSSKRISGASCSLRSPNLDRLEQTVWQCLMTLPIYVDKLVKSSKESDEKEEIEKQIVHLEAQAKDTRLKVNRLLDLYADGAGESPEVAKKLKALEIELSRTSNTIDQLQAKKKVTEQMGDDVERVISLMKDRSSSMFDNEQRWGIVRQFIENIVVEWDEKSRLHEVTIEFKFQAQEWTQTIILGHPNGSPPTTTTPHLRSCDADF